jgi:formate dehydrogenase maturation protein FdhE
MTRTLRVVGDDRSFTITGVERGEWEGMDDACPACGGREFDHVATAGGHYGVRDGTAVLRSDFWDADRAVRTRCRDCGTVLHKHPAFDLLFGPDADGGAGFDP